MFKGSIRPKARFLESREHVHEMTGFLSHWICRIGFAVEGVQPLIHLRGQLGARLKPVLRAADFDAFDLDRAFQVVSEMAKRLSD